MDNVVKMWLNFDLQAGARTAQTSPRCKQTSECIFRKALRRVSSSKTRCSLTKHQLNCDYDFMAVSLIKWIPYKVWQIKFSWGYYHFIAAHKMIMNIVPLKLADPAGNQHVCSCPPFLKHSDKLIPTNSNKLALVLGDDSNHEPAGGCV